MDDKTLNQYFDKILSSDLKTSSITIANENLYTNESFKNSAQEDIDLDGGKMTWSLSELKNNGFSIKTK